MTQETKRRMVRMTIAAVGAAGLVSLHAQAPVPQSPTFEVASIKRNTSGQEMVSLQPSPGGLLTITNAIRRRTRLPAGLFA